MFNKNFKSRNLRNQITRKLFGLTQKIHIPNSIMSKQRLTASNDNSGKTKETKEDSSCPQTLKYMSEKPQYTFYQPHLSQPPTDYMFLDDSPTLKTTQQPQTTTKVEKPGTNFNLEQTPNKKRLESGASCRDSYGLSDDNPVLSVKSKLMEEWEVCQTQEKDSNESIRGSRGEIKSQKSLLMTETEPTEETPLSPRRCSLEGKHIHMYVLTCIIIHFKGKFIPQTNHMPPSKIKPTTVERGYLLWQVEKTGDEVDHLETIMQRTVEQKQLETESENTILERNV